MLDVWHDAIESKGLVMLHPTFEFGSHSGGPQDRSPTAAADVNAMPPVSMAPSRKGGLCAVAACWQHMTNAQTASLSDSCLWAKRASITQGIGNPFKRHRGSITPDDPSRSDNCGKQTPHVCHYLACCSGAVRVDASAWCHGRSVSLKSAQLPHTAGHARQPALVPVQTSARRDWLSVLLQPWDSVSPAQRRHQEAGSRHEPRAS